MSDPKVGEHNSATIHYSVGAVIHKDGRYLLIDRGVPPPGFAGVAGHIDEGEEAKEAIAREVAEETGLHVESMELLWEEFVEWNWCSKGVTGHYWYVYACEVSGEIARDERETKSAGWYSAEEIKVLPLERVWEYWFQKLHII